MAVAFDSIIASLQANGSGPYSSDTISFTVNSGSDIVLVVIVWGLNNSSGSVPTVTSVVFNTSESLTKQVEITQSGGPSRQAISVWTLLNPTVTTANVVVTWDVSDIDSTAVHVLEYTGSDAIGANSSGSGNDNIPTHSITTTVDNSMIVAGICFRGADGEPFSPDNSETERADGESGTSNSADISFWAAELLKATAGAQTISATGSAADRWTIASVELKVASVGGLPIPVAMDYYRRLRMGA
ncbi:hypothetical protein LCGC14_2142290 [marine sediment metagenome]|uniref:Uncharacterized protein n=1 Tax=marine sediment metagenome TaxID=412755 RepID=A0A0F9GU93_9ZZZZ